MKRNTAREILTVSGLEVWRGPVRILKGLDWTIKPGENWAILGSNGSGKTSLLNSLTGYLTPSKGQITLLGQRYGRSDWRELRKRVGIVSSWIAQMMSPDEPAWRTVASGQSAVIGLWDQASGRSRRDALRILQEVGCQRLQDRPWAFLSQGERQRVLIGRALLADPAILILDEPCAGLDPVAREHFLQFLQRLARRRGHPALVLVTHHVEEIMPVFSHVLLLRDGRILASGPRALILTEEWLRKTFGARLKLGLLDDGRSTLSVAPKRRRVL